MQTTNKSADDLDYLSQLGFEKIPVSDNEITDLARKVKVRFSAGPKFGYLAGLSGLAGIFIGALCFYLFYTPAQKPEVSDLKSSSEPKIISDDKNQANEIVLDTVEVHHENFIRPRVTKVNTLKARQTVIAGQSDTTQAYIMEPTQISLPPAEILTEQKIKFIINSPVIFIHDLKVSDYTSLYFKKNQFVKFNDRPGVSAEYSGKNENLAGTSHLKPQADYFLHQELADALLYFKQKKYDACIVSLNEVNTYNKSDVNCDFYLAMCYYNKRNFTKALSHFDLCIENLNNAFLQEAIYYKALTLLEQGNKSEAQQIFRKISEEGEFYSEKAKAVLENL